ncbi:hypothetical protein BDF21DRAFT_447730 [Thamnidium elegans]|nr:hypothetical protein BDF21DRAFT_447730 [Thamnidium elegans]
MNIDTLMNEMSVQEDNEAVTEEAYVSLYQKHSEPAEVNICKAMECDEELAEELEENEEEEEEEVEETLEEVNARVEEYFNAHLNQPELKRERDEKIIQEVY